MKKIKWLLEAALLITVSLPLAILPYKLALKVGEMLGVSIFHLWRSRRNIAVENMQKSIQAGGLEILESPESIARASFKNFGRSSVEVIKIYYGLGRKIIDETAIKGIENYQAAASKNKGVILITGHCGNWELMAVTLSVKVCNVSVVARAQDNPYLNKFIEKVRAKYGNRVIYKKGALKGILSEIKKDGTVGILMDQAVLKDEGYVIDFLGRGAWTTKMPALIARKTGTPVIPVFINLDGDRHIINIYSEVALSGEEDTEKAVMEDTKRFTGFIEEHIRQHPAEWLWIHRRWKRVNDG
jgi:KDO2-lipid IV(A) lauroyltransferase